MCDAATEHIFDYSPFASIRTRTNWHFFLSNFMHTNPHNQLNKIYEQSIIMPIPPSSLSDRNELDLDARRQSHDRIVFLLLECAAKSLPRRVLHVPFLI